MYGCFRTSTQNILRGFEPDTQEREKSGSLMSYISKLNDIKLHSPGRFIIGKEISSHHRNESHFKQGADHSTVGVHWSACCHYLPYLGIWRLCTQCTT